MADAYELPAYDFAHLRENMIKVTKDPEGLSQGMRGRDLTCETGDPCRMIQRMICSR